MTRYRAMALGAGLVALVFGSLAADAALPPKYAKMRRDSTYAAARSLQKKAPEVLEIVVSDVKVREVSGRFKCIAERHYDVGATVLKVTRSRSGLRRGKRLRFTYSQRYQCKPGPRRYNAESVAKGQRATVYLEAIKGKYTIAASVLSIARHEAKAGRGKPRRR